MIALAVLATMALASCGGNNVQNDSQDDSQEIVLWERYTQDVFVDSAKAYFEIDSVNTVRRSKNGREYNEAFDDNLVQWLASDSCTMECDLSKLVEAGVLNYVESDDQKLRIYNWAALFDHDRYVSWSNVIQTKCGGHFSGYVQSVFCMVHDCGEQSDSGEPVEQIFTVKDDDDHVHYLVGIKQNDFNYIIRYCLHSFEIKNGLLEPDGLMDACVDFDANDEKTSQFVSQNGCVYRYDAQSKRLYVPESEEGLYAGKNRVYEFDGRKFVNKGVCENQNTVTD